MKKSFDLMQINENMRTNPRKQILDTESRYRGQLFVIADRIVADHELKMVLMAGPSCAGKTTTARLLKEILERMGKNVITISLDDFFIDRDKTPVLPNGLKDYDSPRALDTEQMKECFTELFTGRKTGFPKYDFLTGKNIKNDHELQLKYNTIIIFEGLHVLNPLIIKSLGTEKYFSIYVNADTGFKFKKEKIKTLDLRLIRRMIRDISRRNNSVKDTLRTWDTVCEAEKKYISKYKKTCDAIVDTTHEFELGVLRAEMERMQAFKGINFDKVKEVQFLNYADTVDKGDLPDTTLMWEFVDPPQKEENTEKKE